MSDDGFELVRAKRRRGRHDNAIRDKSQLIKDAKSTNTFLPELSEGRAKNVDDELLRLEDCKREVKESDFYSKFLTIQTSLLERSGMTDVGIVCYGLGKISSCPIARYQFSLLLLMTSDLNVGPIKCHVYDPVFNDTDKELVVINGFSLIPFNEEGCRPVDSPTIFYMPHCGKLLYDNVLRANWSCNRLSKVIIIGNKFNHYRERIVRSQLEREAPCIDRVLRYMTERALPTCFRHNDVFNDLAIHSFTVPADVCQEYWNDVPHAVIDPNDSEIIRAGRIV